MRQLLNDIVLAEGNNELNVSMTPLPPAIPPGALVFELRNPPAATFYWRAIVMNGGIYYRNSFRIGEIGYVEVPEGQIPEMRAFVCMLYDADHNLLDRRDIEPPGGFTYGAHYYYDWASNTFG